MKPLKIYVSGPLTNDNPDIVTQNISDAVNIGIDLLAKGHHCLVPHLSYHLEKVAKQRKMGFDYEKYMALDLALLSMCDAIYFMGSSPGADRERELAIKLGKPVFTCMCEIEDADEL
jgi:hypothetical protein